MVRGACCEALPVLLRVSTPPFGRYRCYRLYKTLVPILSYLLRSMRNSIAECAERFSETNRGVGLKSHTRLFGMVLLELKYNQ